MAKLIKIVGYLVSDDDVDECEIEVAAKEILESKFDSIGYPFSANSVSLRKDLFFSKEWYNNPLNKVNCSIKDIESYFKREKLIMNDNFLNKEIGRMTSEMDKYVNLKELVEQFVEMDKEYNGELWTLEQILANICMVKWKRFC